MYNMSYCRFENTLGALLLEEIENNVMFHQ